MSSAGTLKPKRPIALRNSSLDIFPLPSVSHSLKRSTTRAEDFDRASRSCSATLLSESSSTSNPRRSVFLFASLTLNSAMRRRSSCLWRSRSACTFAFARAIFPLYAAASLLAALATRAASIGISGRSSSSSHAGALPSLSPLNGSKRKRLTRTSPPCSCGRMRTRALPSASTASTSSSRANMLASPPSSCFTSSSTVNGGQYSPCTHGTYSPLARLRALSLSSAASLSRSSVSALACASAAAARAASFTISSSATACASANRFSASIISCLSLSAISCCNFSSSAATIAATSAASAASAACTAAAAASASTIAAAAAASASSASSAPCSPTARRTMVGSLSVVTAASADVRLWGASGAAAGVSRVNASLTATASGPAGEAVAAAAAAAAVGCCSAVDCGATGGVGDGGRSST